TLVHCAFTGDVVGDLLTGSSTLTATAPSVLGLGATVRDGATGSTAGVLVADPQLGPLKDNGGPTRTLAPGLNSPVPNPRTAPITLLTDQRGAARGSLADGSNGGNGTPPDLGAYEVHHPLSPVGVPTDFATMFGPHPNADATEALVRGLYQAV